MRSSLALACLLAASPAWGFETTAGPAKIVAVSDMVRALSVGERVHDLPTEPYSAFIEAQVEDWLLILLSQGGNACAGEFTWAKVSPGGVEFSPVFGTCADSFELERLDGAVEVTMAAAEVGQGPVRFHYDGDTLSFENLPLQPVGWRLGDDPAFWEGRYVFDLFGAAELEPVLHALLNDTARADAFAAAELGQPFDWEGDWFVGEACGKFDCAEARVAVAISGDGETLQVAVRAPGKDPVFATTAKGVTAQAAKPELPPGALAPTIAEILARP